MSGSSPISFIDQLLLEDCHAALDDLIQFVTCPAKGEGSMRMASKGIEFFRLGTNCNPYRSIGMVAYKVMFLNKSYLHLIFLVSQLQPILPVSFARTFILFVAPVKLLLF